VCFNIAKFYWQFQRNIFVVIFPWILHVIDVINYVFIYFWMPWVPLDHIIQIIMKEDLTDGSHLLISLLGKPRSHTHQ
jgi:hypothetical protein